MAKKFKQREKNWEQSDFRSVGKKNLLVAGKIERAGARLTVFR